MENLKQASSKRNLSTGMAPNFFSAILRFVASFSLQFIFFSEQPFYLNYSTLDCHTNTVISHTFAYRQDGAENRDKVYCSWTEFKRRKMLNSVKRLTKYVIIIYLCIRFVTWKVRRLNQSRSKGAPKAKFAAGLGEKRSRTAEPFQIETGIVSIWFNLTTLYSNFRRLLRVQVIVKKFGLAPCFYSWIAAFRELFLEALTSLLLKLKAKGRGKSHRFNFFLVEGLIVAHRYVLCKSGYFVKENAIDFYSDLLCKIWFPRRLFRRDKSSELSRLIGNLYWGRHCISWSCTRTTRFLYLRTAFGHLSRGNFCQSILSSFRITKRSGKQNSLRSWAVVVSWV